MRVCLDLTPNEMMDRHGGFGRYVLYLLEAMLALPAEERAGIELYALPWSHRAPLPAAEGRWREVLQRPLISPWRHRVQRRRLVAWGLRRAGIELFHAAHTFHLPRLAPCPMIATAHDLIPITFPSFHDGPLRGPRLIPRTVHYALQFRRLARIIAISGATRDDLVRHLRLDPRRIDVVHHGVEMSRFRPAEPGAAEDEAAALGRRFDLPARYFITVGSDHYRKNQGRLLAAWLTVADRLPEGLVIVGRTLYRRALERLYREVERRGLQQKVRWLDDVDDEALPGLYRGATALCAPSLYEGFGLTLLEAMACGTAVAAARSSSYPEVGGEAADYFDPHSEAEMAEAMLRLSADEAHRKRRQDQGLNHAASFTWAETARQTLAVYRKAAEIPKKK